MTKRSWQGKSIRTSITLNRALYKDLRELMNKLGWGDNFSAFISHLARQERARMRRQRNVEDKLEHEEV